MDEVTLPETLPSIDGVDRKIAQFYEQQDDGSYRLTSIEALLNAKRREKEEKRKFKQIAEEYQSKLGGLSDAEVEELISLKEAKKQEEVRKLEEKRQWEALKRQMEENHQKQIQESKSEAQRNWSLLEKYVREDHLRRALEERNATETGKQILPQLLKDRVKIATDDNGSLALRFFDEYGAPIMVNSKNEDYSLDDFMDEVYNRYDDLFLGANRSGTGATISAKHAAKTNKMPSTMSAKEKADFIGQFGEEAYTRLLQLDMQKRRQQSA